MKGRKSRAKRAKRSHTHSAETQNSTQTGRLNTQICRLCHGRFSARKLRRAFGSHPGPVPWPSSPEHPTRRFCSDFQQLLGMAVRHDSSLSPYICSDCHAQFYQCHSILQAFRHRVNSTPSLNTNAGGSSSTWTPFTDESAPPITSDPHCLLRLVSWTHEHAGSCSFPPGLQEVLEERCGGVAKVVWSCGDGHSYTMDTGVWERHGDDAHNHLPITTRKENSAHPHTEETQSSAYSLLHAGEPDGAPQGDQLPSPAQRGVDSDQSDRNFSSEDEEEVRKSSEEDGAHATPDTM